MFFYQAHGLSINSVFQFSELITGNRGSDVEIRYGKLDIPLSNIEFKKIIGRSKVLIKNKQIFFIWDSIPICKITEGKEITINKSTGIEENLLKTLILGPAFAALLHQRGRLVLHASAVNMDGSAVAFLGPRGRGKSTTSVALNKNGYNLLSDDVLSVQINGNETPVVFPSFPRIKLRPEVINNIEEDAESLPKVYSNSDKRSYNTLNNFSDSPIPLKSIYLIEEGTKIRIQDMNPKESLIELIKGSFCLELFDKKDIRENFNQCSKLVNTVHVKKLQVKRSFEDLPKLVEAIEEDVRLKLT